MAGLWRDVKYALRTLLKNRLVTGIAIFSLALAIGGNATVFSMVDAFILQPPPVESPESLVLIGERARSTPDFVVSFNTSLPTYADLRDRSRFLTGWAAMEPRTLTLRADEFAEPVSGMSVTEGFFDLVGVDPARGRRFHPEESVEGGPRVALISYEMAGERYPDQDPLGELLRLNGQLHEIVGVMPEGFNFLNGVTDVWLPLTRSSVGASRTARSLVAVARMGPDVTTDQVTAEAIAIFEDLEREHPVDLAERTARAYNLRYDLPPSQTRTLFALLQVTVLLVLLVACVNIANLLLARFQERTAEISLRTALGADRMQIFRQLMTESVVLSGVGAVLGLAFGWAGITVLQRALAPFLPPSASVALDLRVALFTLGIAVGSGLLFGLLPAVQTLRRDHGGAIRSTGRSGRAGVRGIPLTRVLVVGEVALSMVALGVGSVMVQSFLQIRDADPGFDGSDLLTATLVVPPAEYGEDEERRLLNDRLLDAALAIPEIRSASLSNALPQGFGLASGQVTLDGVANSGAPTFQVVLRRASLEYFDVFDIPLLTGRVFSEVDGPDGPDIAVVNRSFADTRFPETGAVGARIGINGTVHEIVGVVDDVQEILFSTPGVNSGEVIYRPSAKAPDQVGAFAFEVQGDPHAVAPSLRDAVARIDPDLTLSAVFTMDEVIERSTVGIRIFNWVLGGFGIVALFLAALGTYGVLAYSVYRRRREIGVRIAIGATGRSVVGMMTRQGFWMAIVGLALGSLAMLPLLRVIESIMLGITMAGPMVLVVIAGVLFAATMIASLVPALRATGIDPVHALRAE